MRGEGEGERGGERNEGEGEGGGGGGSAALVLYSMHATLDYSIAQHMFPYAVPESPISILLTSVG